VSIPTRARKMIVNADDFGMSAEANKAIVEAFEMKLISSTTIMTNMPGFDEACELAHGHGLVGKVGVHLNLTSGYPLSEPLRQCARFCNDRGMFRVRQTRFWLSKKEMLAVKTEIKAQIKACLDRGLCPTHLDSHHHVHTEWPIGTIVIAVARQYGINAIRLSRNCGPGIGLFHKGYKWAYNTRLKAYGLAKSQYFGSPSDVQEILANASGDVEVMVHLTSESPTTRPDGSGEIGLGRWFGTYQLASYS
jgi:predicted glycoside hydrolase/deacetylase ChbG (UPF0249 family)